MKKIYHVNCPELGFDFASFEVESDRNELALAIWEEYQYVLYMRTLNWYGEDGIYTGIKEDASANIVTWYGWVKEERDIRETLNKLSNFITSVYERNAITEEELAEVELIESELISYVCEKECQ